MAYLMVSQLMSFVCSRMVWRTEGPQGGVGLLQSVRTCKTSFLSSQCTIRVVRTAIARPPSLPGVSVCSAVPEHGSRTIRPVSQIYRSPCLRRRSSHAHCCPAATRYLAFHSYNQLVCNFASAVCFTFEDGAAHRTRAVGLGTGSQIRQSSSLP